MVGATLCSFSLAGGESARHLADGYVASPAPRNRAALPPKRRPNRPLICNSPQEHRAPFHRPANKQKRVCDDGWQERVVLRTPPHTTTPH